MPFIDVSDVILDPFLAGDPFVVIRRRTTVNDHGEGEEDKPVRFDAVGSVTPLGDNSLIREDAYATQAETVQIITTFQLRGAGVDGQGNEFQPDQIEYDGQVYTVVVLESYAKFGAGFVRAECATQAFSRKYGTPE